MSEMYAILKLIYNIIVIEMNSSIPLIVSFATSESSERPDISYCFFVAEEIRNGYNMNYFMETINTAYILVSRSCCHWFWLA